MIRSSSVGLQTFVVADPVYNLDERLDSFGIDCSGDEVYDLVSVGCLR